MQRIENYESGTFAMSFRYIEGYLLKEIDSTGLFRRTKRHLRFFRIIYTQGKLNVKEDKSKNEMRSFLLKDLIAIQILKESPSEVLDEPSRPQKMMDVKNIRETYNVDPISEK